MSNIQTAINTAGGAQALAELIAVPAQSVYFWRSGARRVPAEYCPAIERVTGVRCEDLRPDVEWGVLRVKPTRRKPAQTAQEA